MSRQMTKDACKAFHNGCEFKRSNTEVDGDVEGAWYMWLHGNAIAIRRKGKLLVRSAGWRTSTTKERLNGISGVSVYQENFNWYLNGELWEIDSEWTEVK